MPSSADWASDIRSGSAVASSMAVSMQEMAMVQMGSGHGGCARREAQQMTEGLKE